MEVKIINFKVIFLCLFLIFLSFSCVNAEDNQVNSNFSNLSDEISHSNSNITLTKNYTQLENENNINIEKSIEIDGEGHSINSNNENSLFNVNSNVNLTFKNISFNYENQKLLDSKPYLDNISITFLNCTFNLKNVILYSKDPSLKTHYCCKVTNEIKNLALSIVGKSTDLDAAKKLAKWVSVNIKFEKKEGFYQTPSKTLLRKKANCCCQSELFLQMCEAVGITKEHEVYFVHVGTMTFGYRHFFTMIDNICIDVTLNKYWGKGGFSNKTVFSITKYPMLPI